MGRRNRRMGGRSVGNMTSSNKSQNTWDLIGYHTWTMNQSQIVWTWSIFCTTKDAFHSDINNKSNINQLNNFETSKCFNWLRTEASKRWNLSMISSYELDNGMCSRWWTRNITSEVRSYICWKNHRGSRGILVFWVVSNRSLNQKLIYVVFLVVTLGFHCFSDIVAAKSSWITYSRFFCQNFIVWSTFWVY